MSPMPPRKAAPRKRYHHGDLPNALLRAAEDIVARKGVEAFSVREAARSVGVDAAAAYRHFRDKPALLAAVAREGFCDLARAMEQALQVQTDASDAAAALARFRALGQVYVSFARKHPARFGVMFGPHGAGAAQGAVRGVGAEGLSPYELLVRSLDELHALGVFARTSAESAMMAWASVHGVSALLIAGAVSSPNEEAPGNIADRLIDFVVAGLASSERQPLLMPRPQKL